MLSVVVFGGIDELIGALIPFVFVGIWALWQIWTKANQPPAAGPRGPRMQGPGGPQAEGGPVVWRTPKEEIERFLQEVRRRQQQEQQRAAERAGMDRPVPTRQQPSSAPQRPKRAQGVEADRGEQPSRKQPALMAGAGGPREGLRNAAAGVAGAGMTGAGGGGGISGASVVEAVEGRGAEMRALLASPAGIRQAVIANEILSAPLADRPML